MLIPCSRQTKRLVPGRQLHRAGAGIFRQHDGQHFDKDTVDIVFRLLLGQAQRIDLNAIPEPAQFRVFNTVAIVADVVPQLGERPHFRKLGYELDPRIHKETDAADNHRKIFVRHLAGGFHTIQDSNGGCQCKGKFLRRRRAGFLQVIRAHIHRVPFGTLDPRPCDGIGDQPHRRLRRKHIGAARKILLDDVVLRGAGKAGPRSALFFCNCNIQRQQPGSRSVDRHGRVHPLQRNVFEQGAHVADVGHRHANLANLAARQQMIAVVPGLGWQIEGHRQAGLALVQVAPVQFIAGFRRGMTRIGAKDPRSVTIALVAHQRLIRLLVYLMDLH